MHVNLSGNIWKYTLLLIANKRVFAAILGAYYLTIPGVTPWWIGMLLLAGSVSGFIFEIPSGYISDKVGHKTALVFSRLAMLLATTLFLLADAVPLLIFATVFWSLGNSFFSGTGSAFMHETFRALNREEEYTHVMGKVSAIGFAVPAVLMALVPFLIEISYKAPFLVALIMDVVGLYATIALVKPPVSPEHVAEVGVTNFTQVVREGYRLKFLRYALFAGIISGVLFVVSGFRAPYQTLLEIPVIWFGVLFATGRILASGILVYSGKIKEWTGDIHVFNRYQLIIYGALLLALGLATTWWIIAMIFIVLNGLQWGLSRIQEGYHLEIISTSKFKATLLSIRAQFDEMSITVWALFLGSIIEQTSYRLGFVCLSVAFIAVMFPLYLYTRRI
jgi:MFS family permease